MTITEASAVNTVLDHLTGAKYVPHDKLREAAAALANGAHKKLMAGWTGESIAATLDETQHTANGYDPRWVAAINGVLADRESDVRAIDLDDAVWEQFVGPLCDVYEDDEVPALTRTLAVT
jgi:hypothetical protein